MNVDIQARLRRHMLRRHGFYALCILPLLLCCLFIGRFFLTSSPAFLPVRSVQYEKNRSTKVYNALQECYTESETMVMLMLEAAANPHNESARLAAREYIGSHAAGSCTDDAFMQLLFLESEQPSEEQVRSFFAADFSEKTAMLLSLHSGKTIPWSYKTLYMQGCCDLAVFMQDRAPTYLYYLDLLDYVISDPEAQYNGYADTAITFITDILYADAAFLVGSYQLTCDPHLNEYWNSYRSNPATETHYTLYQAYAVVEADDNLLMVHIQNATADRQSAMDNFSRTGIPACYERWLRNQSS